MAKFSPGQSGNPGGRPRTIAALRELAQAEAENNVRALVAIRDNKRAPVAARVAAIRELFDRGFGRPAQSNEVAFNADWSMTVPDAHERLLELLARRRAAMDAESGQTEEKGDNTNPPPS